MTNERAIKLLKMETECRYRFEGYYDGNGYFYVCPRNCKYCKLHIKGSEHYELNLFLIGKLKDEIKEEQKKGLV